MPAFLHWLHVYFDDDSCMEVTALKGSCEDVQYFADRIIARVAHPDRHQPRGGAGEPGRVGDQPTAAGPDRRVLRPDGT
jgi:hypothetical protein